MEYANWKINFDIALFTSSSGGARVKGAAVWEWRWWMKVMASVDAVDRFLSSWSGSHIRWGQPFRLRHVTTGKYLSLLDDKGLLLMDKEKADVKSTAFCFRSSKVNSL